MNWFGRPGGGSNLSARQLFFHRPQAMGQCGDLLTKTLLGTYDLDPCPKHYEDQYEDYGFHDLCLLLGGLFDHLIGRLLHQVGG